MKPSAVIFLKQEPLARQMVGVWPVVWSPDFEDAGELWEAWSRASGVPLWEVKRLGPVLLENDICEEGGTIDPRADLFIQSVAVAGLPRRKSS